MSDSKALVFFQQFNKLFLHALKSLLPIIIVVLFFQFVIFQSLPPDPFSLSFGLLIVAVGIALFLLGLELSIFPVGKSLANQFAQKSSLTLLLCFGFAIGFAAVIAEPALIAVAQQAEIISQGRVNGMTLRVIIALSVGAVMAIGILRTVLGWPIHWLMIPGYALVLLVSFFSPKEIIGLAYDSGGVTTNIVTVPLIAAIGIGLANSLGERNILTDGFGLVALAVMVPMISVQLYGIWVYNFSEPGEVIHAVEKSKELPLLLKFIVDLVNMLKDILPMILVVLIFQYLILRKPLSKPMRVVFGFSMVLLGLYAFVVGLKLGLFPMGTIMAEQLIDKGATHFILLFAFMLGFATTMAEPALIAIGEQVEKAAPGRIHASALRITVAFGVAIGITIGAYRIISGDPIHYYIMVIYFIVVFMTWVSPRYITALAYDLGGVTASAVTVPLVTALGISLANSIEGRDVLIDGFGLIIFATIFPIITVMLYAIIVDLLNKDRSKS